MDLKGKGSNLFEEIVNNAKEFVEKQKGKWDHTKWETFLKDTQKKGISLTDDLSNTLGSILESLKNFYATLPKGKVEEIVNNAQEFVEKQKGRWDHAKWENFLSELQKKGVALTDDLSNSVGSILESLRKFYTILPATLKKGEEAPGETTETQPSQETPQSEIKEQDTAETAVVQEQLTEKVESVAAAEDTQPETAEQTSPDTEDPKTVEKKTGD